MKTQISYKKYKKNKGSVLAYILVIMAIVSIVLVSMLEYISSQLRFSANRLEKERAFQVAEAGIYYYRWYLAHKTTGKSPTEVNAFWQGGTALGDGTAYEADYEGLGKYSIEIDRPSPGSTIVTVRSTGWSYKTPNMKRTVKVRFRRPSWSEYAVLANDFMRFGAGTEIYGKVHSNKGIRLDGKAYNIVSSLVPVYDDPDHVESGVDKTEFGVHTHVNAPPATGINDNYRPLETPPSAVQSRSDVFVAGRQFPVSEVSFNGVLSDLALMRTESQKPGGTNINNCTASGCYFDNDFPLRITLRSDGKMEVCQINDYNSSTYKITKYQKNGTTSSNKNCDTCAGQCAPKIYDIPSEGIIFVENNIWVEGVINNKRITLAAADISGGTDRDIYIGTNNLLYTNLDGRDIIGLVAQKNISVVAESQNILTIDAALLAQSGRVGRNLYSSSYDKNTITVNGSIATNQRYGFAYTDGSGYDNRILNFDNNLLYFPPPYFPTGTDYAIDLWEEL